jgi:hypothetical protein
LGYNGITRGGNDMVYCASDNDVLLQSVNELGINISKEEIDTIVTEATEKVDAEHYIDKMHPLTRAFVNLAKNKEEFIRITLEAL